jgi:chitinase
MFTPKLLHWLCLYFLWLAFGKADQRQTDITPVPRGLATRELPEGTCTKDIPCANKACCNGSVVSLVFPWTVCFGHMLTLQ